MTRTTVGFPGEAKTIATGLSLFADAPKRDIVAKRGQGHRG